MSGAQAQLGEFASESATPSDSNPLAEDTESEIPRLGYPDSEALPDTVTQRADAATAEWIIYTGRYPHVFDAIRLGFGIGHREDSSYQWNPGEVELPVHFLDNNYRDASLERFTDRVFETEPEIAVLGDIYEQTELDSHLRAAETIWSSYPDINLMLVPKTQNVLTDIPSEFVLGYPNGSSDIQADDVADYHTWRQQENRVHILGGTPLSTHHELCELTKPTVTGLPAADIAGLDWNGYQRYAENHGDYADATGGWHRNLRDRYLPKRDLIQYSLLNAKCFWTAHGVWPTRTPEDLPSRASLLNALDGTLTTPQPAADTKTLLTSPGVAVDRRASPLYRTDETQTEIHEPLSPLATIFSDTTSWRPDGNLSGAAAFEPPQGHFNEPTCFGCGAHVFAEPTAAAGYHPEDTELTARLVSYESNRQDAQRDYASVPNDGPEHLQVDVSFPAIRWFCSKSCQSRAERQTPHLLVNVDESQSCYPSGTTIGSLTVSVKNEGHR